jgi:peroxiredoxin
MVATLYLLGCVLVPGQASRPAVAAGDWLLVPRLSRSQEMVYRGSFSEEGRGGRVQFGRTYRIETRLFVLDTPPTGAEVGVLTVLWHRPSTGEPPSRGEGPTASVRLERVRVDLQGKVAADPGARLTVPLDGAPSLECGAFVALPGGHVRVGQEWAADEDDRPPVLWRAVGTELVGGQSCLKLVGEQKSDDWDRPRADHTAWHRRDTVWLVPRLGLAHRLEREIKQREPARQEATQRSLLRLEMESSFQLSGEAADGRAREITQALAFRDALAPMLAHPARYAAHLGALLKKIDYHLERQPDTPYRVALLQVKRRAEAARRGEAPPQAPPETRAAPAVISVGHPAPDFIATQLTGPGSGRLRQWAGKPVVLVFYHPASATTPAVLAFARDLAADFSHRLTVVGMCVADDAEAVSRQHAELGLTFPVLSAGGLRAGFGVESTPKIVLLDGAHVVRGEYLGWGQETPREVREELKRWLPVGVTLPPTPQPR